MTVRYTQERSIVRPALDVESQPHEQVVVIDDAKSGLRAVAQSMARELGKKNIHVAHVVCDGSIDGVFARENFADLDQRLAEDRVLKPDDIALNYVSLHHQKRSAWTHELDLRP